MVESYRDTNETKRQQYGLKIQPMGLNNLIK